MFVFAGTNGEVRVNNIPPVDTGQEMEDDRRMQESLEEERRIIQHQLSNMPAPRVGITL